MSKEKLTEIDEAIADAIAEEEVKKEQIKAEAEKKAAANTTDFREELKRLLKQNFSDKNKENKVTLDLDEYIILKFKERDLEKIVNAIVAELKLGYDKEYLRKDSDEIVNAFKVIYPEAYEAILEDLIEEDQSKEG